MEKEEQIETRQRILVLNTNLHGGIFPRNTMSQKEVGMRNSEMFQMLREEEGKGGKRKVKNEKGELEIRG